MTARGDLVSSVPPFETARQALKPQFTVAEGAGTELEVRDDLEKLVCRLGVTEVPGWGWTVTLDGLRGYEAERDQIRWLLQQAGFVPSDEMSTAAVSLDASDRADVAVTRVCARLLQVLDANLPGTLADTDIEFLHDYRVAIRRTRSVLKEMRGVFPAVELGRLRVEFKWIQEVTGPTRDLDVYLGDFEELRQLAPAPVRKDLDPLLGVLRSWHLDAREQMERELVSVRARQLHDEWATLLDQLPQLPEEDRPDALRPIAELTGERILHVHRRMVKMGRAIDSGSPPEEYHELRKQGKELRYLLELFATPLYDPAVVKPLVKTLKGLQDVLGTHQDRDVQIHTLRKLGDHVLAQAGGGAALLAMGALVEHLEADAQNARQQFAASFGEFASEAQCELVSSTFKR